MGAPGYMSTDIERWDPPNDPTAFESLCLDLWKDIWQDSGAQKNGRRGQKQDGVDIFGQNQGKWEGVQCKQKDGLLRSKVTGKELEQEVEAAMQFKPPLAKLILTTTGPRDANVQERARELTEEHKRQGLFTVEVWSWDEVWHEIYQREKLLKRIVQSYWPHLAAIRSGKDRVIASSRLFRGRNAGSDLLIGRRQELADLDAAWNDASKKNIVKQKFFVEKQHDGDDGDGAYRADKMPPQLFKMPEKRHFFSAIVLSKQTCHKSNKLFL